MDNRDLENINASGELTSINLGGTTAAKNVLTREQITALPVSTATQAALDLKADDLFLGEAITTTTPTGSPVAGNYYLATSDGNVSYTNFGGQLFNKLDRIVWTGSAWGKQTNWESKLVPITGVRSDVDLGDNDLYIRGATASDKALTKNTLGYKVYTALLTQSGTDAPVATVLENTLGGNIVWTRSIVGNYIGTLEGIFTFNKTFIITGTATDTDEANPYSVDVYVISTDVIHISTFNLGGPILLDGLLTNTPIEIKVYD